MPLSESVIVLDGPLGTELEARGVPTPLPGWSSHALEEAPEVVGAIHADYARAGATVHTTNTFRTRASVWGAQWEALARSAVRIARGAVPAGHRIAGSIAPLEDCYRPDLSPAPEDPDGVRAEHGALARVLAEAGCDLLLCETFPHVGEASLALEGALATGLETWIAWTPGPHADLLTPTEVAAAAEAAVERGASAVLVNCVPLASALAYVRELVAACGSPDSMASGRALVGVYANTGTVHTATGWTTRPLDASTYAEAARSWVEAGARIIGGCCGTGPAVTAALAAL